MSGPSTSVYLVRAPRAPMRTMCCVLSSSDVGERTISRRSRPHPPYRVATFHTVSLYADTGAGTWSHRQNPCPDGPCRGELPVDPAPCRLRRLPTSDPVELPRRAHRSHTPLNLRQGDEAVFCLPRLCARLPACQMLRACLRACSRACALARTLACDVNASGPPGPEQLFRERGREGEGTAAFEELAMRRAMVVCSPCSDGFAPPSWVPHSPLVVGPATWEGDAQEIGVAGPSESSKTCGHSQRGFRQRRVAHVGGCLGGRPRVACG